jgi:hypothetical protein
MLTDPTMALQALLEKSSDTDLLRDLVGFTAQRNGYRRPELGNPCRDHRTPDDLHKSRHLHHGQGAELIGLS